MATHEEHADIVTIPNFTRPLKYGVRLDLPDCITDPEEKNEKKNKKDRRKRKRGPRKKRGDAADTGAAEDDGDNNSDTGEQST